MRAVYAFAPQLKDGKPKTYEECYGVAPLDHRDDREEMEIAIRVVFDGLRLKEGRIVSVARCPEHGLHGCRETCFECGKPVEQVPMVELDFPCCDECGGTGRYPVSEYNARVHKQIGTLCPRCNGSGTRFDLSRRPVEQGDTK